MARWVFKILREDEWRDAATTSSFDGSPADRQDGFIHLSTFEQLAGTATKHFAGETELKILVFDAETWTGEQLKWEPSRGGALFPHLYGTLDVGAASKVWHLETSPGGSLELAAIDQWIRADD